MAPPEAEKKSAVTYTASAVLPDGELVEMVYDPVARKTQFVCGTADAWGYEESVLASPEERLVPYSATNNLVKHSVVLFPSEPAEYGDVSALVSRIRDFVRRHVELSEEFELISTYYVLFSWVYDAFHEVPYVRVRGGYGSGKTRFLLTVGSLCRLPIFASAASTVSPIFRLLDSFRGTLILDEGDFRYSDEKAEIIKVLNHGNSRGFPVLRTEVSSKKEFDPKAYHVFGPKIVATRGFFQDKALESRCLTEDMRGGAVRSGIPLNLDERFHEEAREIRNQLLLYRLRHFKNARAEVRAGARDLEPRLQHPRHHAGVHRKVWRSVRPARDAALGRLLGAASLGVAAVTVDGRLHARAGGRRAARVALRPLWRRSYPGAGNRQSPG